jgi:hypothetical protein
MTNRRSKSMKLKGYGFSILLLGIMLGMSNCEQEQKEENPYPDGVYPFEVSDVSYTVTDHINQSVTWTTPADVSRVDVEMFWDDVNHADHKIYPFNPEEQPDIAYHYHDITLKRDSFSFKSGDGTDRYVIIKCVDKFGNISSGVKYRFSYYSD